MMAKIRWPLHVGSDGKLSDFTEITDAMMRHCDP